MPGLIDRFLNTNTQQTGPEGNPVSELLRQCKRSFVFVAVLTFVIEVLSLAPIIFMWNVFDRVVSSRSGVTLVSLLLVVMLIISFWSTLEWVRTRMMIRISLRIDWDIAARVFDTAFRRNVSRKAVDVHQAMSDVVTLRQFLTGAPFMALMSAPYAVLFIAVGYAFHPYLALFILIASVVQLLAAYSTSKVTTPALREANNAQAEAKRIAAQSLRQSDSALALGMLPALRRRWFAKHQNFLGLQVNASESAGLMGGFTSFLNNALMPMQIALAAYLVIIGELTGGMMIAAMLLLRKAIQPIMQVMSSWPSIQSAKQSLERLNAMVAEDVAFEDHMKLPAPTGHLQVQELISQPAGARRLCFTTLILNSSQARSWPSSAPVRQANPHCSSSWSVCGTPPEATCGSTVQKYPLGCAPIWGNTLVMCPRMWRCLKALLLKILPVSVKSTLKKSSRPPSASACTKPFSPFRRATKLCSEKQATSLLAGKSSGWPSPALCMATLYSSSWTNRMPVLTTKASVSSWK